MKTCLRPIGFSKEAMDSVDCGKPVERWWSNYCEEHRGGFEWWDCPPKPYLRRAFQLLGLLSQLLVWLSPWNLPRLSLRAHTLRTSGYWWSRKQMDLVLFPSQEPRAKSQEPAESARHP